MDTRCNPRSSGAPPRGENQTGDAAEHDRTGGRRPPGRTKWSRLVCAICLGAAPLAILMADLTVRSVMHGDPLSWRVVAWNWSTVLLSVVRRDPWLAISGLGGVTVMCAALGWWVGGLRRRGR